MPFWKQVPGSNQRIELPPPFFLAFRDPDGAGGIEVLVDHKQIDSVDDCGTYLAEFARRLARAMGQAGKADNEHVALIDILDRFQNDLQKQAATPADPMQN